jgi:hypothetical protein
MDRRCTRMSSYFWRATMRAFLGCLLALAAGPSVAEDLYAVGSFDVIQIVDVDTITNSRSGTRRMWVTTIVDQPTKLGQTMNSGIQVAKTLEEFDCIERKTRTLQVALYAADGSSRNIDDAGPGSWFYPIPGSSNGVIISIACDGDRSNSQAAHLRNVTLQQAIDSFLAAMARNRRDQ